jgi:hypothetical protein
MRIVQSVIDKDSFISHFETQMADFQEHVMRMRTQYEQKRCLKKTCPETMS